MSLIQTIVGRYGGWIAADKRSAAIPAPGHSARDRSVSLKLNHDGKLLIHCFSDTDWRDIKAMLLRDGTAQAEDFVTPLRRGLEAGSVRARRRNTSMPRSSTFAHAEKAWAERLPVSDTLGVTYLKLRGLSSLQHSHALGFLHRWGMSPDPKAAKAPCLIAKITNPTGGFCGVQATFLFQSKTGLRKRRLIFGRQSGFAIHLSAPSETLLVGEGLESTASAAQRFGLPAWSVLNTANLAKFAAPPGVNELVIAADNDPAGLTAAHACAELNRANGLRCEIRSPSEDGQDWNDADRNTGAP